MSFFPQLMQSLPQHSLISVSVRGSVVNPLIYLADQLLRGCQSVDNQFQALQNQEIEDFSVHGSKLPDLEAEVVQIQLFIRISLHYLISVDQQDLVLGEFLFLSFGLLADSSLFSYCFGFQNNFVCGYYYSIYPVLLRHLGGVIFVWFFFLLCFNLCPFVTKKKGE